MCIELDRVYIIHDQRVRHSVCGVGFGRNHCKTFKLGENDWDIECTFTGLLRVRIRAAKTDLHRLIAFTHVS